MPIKRLARARTSLPEGYQFGDGGLPVRIGKQITMYDSREYEIGETVQVLFSRDGDLIGIRDKDGVRLTPEVQLWIGAQ